MLLAVSLLLLLYADSVIGYIAHHVPAAIMRFVLV